MEEFIKLVQKLRTLQKEYFKTRNTLTLQACKKAEKEVDEYINAYSNKEITVQKSLFE